MTGLAKCAAFAHHVTSSIAVGVRNMKKHKLVGTLIRRERRQRDLSQEAVADKLKQHRTWLLRIEKGERRIDVVEYLQLARVIGFDPCELLRRMVHNNDKRDGDQ
jgi:ribosome-binding protein aMBF1 (putative translation factor)